MKKEFSRVFIKDMSGDILVLRDREKMWNLPGGKREHGEKAIECAIREVKEETNIIISNLDEVYSSQFLFDHTEWQGYFYFANTASGIPALNEPNKIKGIQFISNLSSVAFSSNLAPLFDYLDRSHILDQKMTQWQ